MSHMEEFSSFSSSSSSSSLTPIMSPADSVEHTSDIPIASVNANLETNPNTNIKVVCRFRPQSSRELQEKGDLVVSFDDSRIGVTVQLKESSGVFNFDKVFDLTSTQENVFEYTAGSIIQDVLKGYNGTIFAYGQTGSGKSYTMMGSSIDAQDKGIIPRLVERIFETIARASDSIEFTVRVSFMEIYMEKIRDLLNPENDNLPIHEDKIRGVYVKGLLEVYVGSLEEVFQVMRKGQGTRTTASTQMNAESSRSHSIFVIQITQKILGLNSESTRSGKLFLVDLAGSEKVGKTGASGQTLEEAKKINKSLSALGMVINALTDGKSKHIPYRDSKLTRMLQESLGGNSRTTLIINCSPSSFNVEETVSTLRFGTRAKSIKNKAKLNIEHSASELKSMVQKSKRHVSVLQSYLTILEKEISLWRSGKIVPKEKWVHPPSFLAPVYSLDSLSESQTSITKSDIQSPLESNPSISSLNTLIEEEEEERDEFLKRENEFSDLIAEKDSQIQALEILYDTSQLDIQNLYDKEQRSSESLYDLEHELTLLRSNWTHLLDTSQEKDIEVDTLKESLTSLRQELNSSRIQIKSLQDSSIASIADSKTFPTESQESSPSRTSSIKGQLQKMNFLEHNLTQLTSIQKALVDQNLNLKKELSGSGRKLTLKQERIGHLEISLRDMEDKLKFTRFENEKELEELRNRVFVKNQTTMNPSWFQSSRIVKPLRGGGDSTSSFT